MATPVKQTAGQKRSGVQHKRREIGSGTHQAVRAAARPSTQDVQAAVMDPQRASPAQLLEIQRNYGNRSVQRLLDGGALAAVHHPDEQHPQPALSRASLPGSMEGGTLDSQTQSQIESARSGGSPLDAGVGTQVGGALGADFSGVKVHTDAKADALNRSLSARAFTTGSDIFFSRGAYQPGSSSGKQLLAHELTHVVQQGSAKLNKVQTKRGTAMPDGARRLAKPNRMQFKMAVGAAHDRYEQEAERVAEQVVRVPTPRVSFAQRASEKDELQPMPLAQRAFVEDGLHAEPAGRRAGTIQRDLDKPSNYKNPNFEQEVAADEKRNDGKKTAKEYSTVAGKGIGKFHNTTSNEELAIVEKKKEAERAKGKNVVHQNSTDLGFLYAQAEMLRDTYNAKCQELADKSRGTLSKRPGDGLKGIDRTLEKMNADYGGDASRMADLTGASIAFDNPDDLIACYKLIATDNLFKITKLKNSLANAYSYGDINMVVAMGEAGLIPITVQREVNGQTVSETIQVPFKGLQIELQLHLQPILTQKQAGHKQYEEQRGIEAKPIYETTKTRNFLETPNLLPADKKRWQELQDEMVAIYAVGWKKVINQSTPFSLGVLFFKQLISSNTRSERKAQEDAIREEYFKKKMREAIPSIG